jgi:hypothetical protein
MPDQQPIAALDHRFLTDSQVRGIVTRALRIHYYHARKAEGYRVLLWCGLSVASIGVAFFLTMKHSPGWLGSIAASVAALAVTGVRWRYSRKHRSLAIQAARWLPLSVKPPLSTEHYQLVCETARLEMSSTLLEADKEPLYWQLADQEAKVAVDSEEYLCPFCGAVLEEADDASLGGLEVPQDLSLWYCQACDQRILTEQEVVEILRASRPAMPRDLSPAREESPALEDNHSWGSRTIPDIP